ncbi:hypothetical protein [Chenggangzhangella methanolivorans]|uniref:Helix-turn-helix domain-containing protein n=1 Tax=Chenggangzhangella methanolivorans TaxID=1437009 RepID=A0A9E6RJE6_9HYPH|nr:hypothetical protein [Chenggangzhangella methanolivorans]QZO02571.1 hypothetical protein K6K41_06255 [Chenggangzhangella methanolivorans]
MKELVEITGLSKSYLFQLAKDGILDRIYFGRRAKYTADSVLRFIELGFPAKAKAKKGRPQRSGPHLNRLHLKRAASRSSNYAAAFNDRRRFFDLCARASRGAQYSAHAFIMGRRSLIS